MPDDITQGAETALANGGYEILKERRSEGLILRFFVTQKHIFGLIFGGAYAYIQDQKQKGQARGLGIFLLRLILLFAWPFMNRSLAKQPFPVQFRRRLEMLGPTYIKLGQILSLREDLLPKSITIELQNLLDRLPAVTFDRYKELIEQSLKASTESMFSWIEPVPLGSASLAQTHRARLLGGEEVVLKVLKPNVRNIIINDTRLLRVTGWFAQLFLARYQPRRLIGEFCRYTLLEVDLRNEANNADTFTANFKDQPDVRFPQIYRAYCSEDVLCMEFFRGSKPDSALAVKLTPEQLDKVIDLGVGATIQMIFQDGFFHADLHPANLIVFNDASAGFIDLGMVGRFDSNTRKRMLYYFYSLVMGDPANAARYLTAITIAGRKSDPDGFRRAVEDLNRRWLRNPNFDDFSLAQLILQSVALAGRYHIQYPGEIVLMVKALITIEGVGNMLTPGIDVADVARSHIQKILFQNFRPAKIAKESLLILPELMDIIFRSPLVITEGLMYLENKLKSTSEDQLAGMRGTLFAGFCLVAGAILVMANASVYLSGFFFVLGFLIAGYGIFARR